MEKTGKKHPIRNLVILIITGTILFRFPLRWVQSMLRYFLSEPKYFIKNWQFLWSVSPRECLNVIVFFVSALLFIISFFGLLGSIFGGGSKKTSGYIDPAGNAARMNAMQNRSYSGSRSGSTRQGTGRSGASNARTSRDTYRKTPASRGRAEEPMVYTFKTGRERYLEQFQDYLKNGLVTREEYEELKRLYDQNYGSRS